MAFFPRTRESLPLWSLTLYLARNVLSHLLHPENRTVKPHSLRQAACVLFSSLTNCRSSPRQISIGQLHALLHFHLRPINVIVYDVPYSFRMRDLILGGVSRLDAFSVYLVQT